MIFVFKVYDPKYFNLSLILSKKNTVKHPELQEAGKTFFNAFFLQVER